MVDPQQQPTSAELDAFSQRVREAGKRLRSRSTPDDKKQIVTALGDEDGDLIALLEGNEIETAHFSMATDIAVLAVTACVFLMLGARAFAKIQI